ncbi:biopolymer transporter ExbD [Methylacidimicrobium sp. B4]|uniref:ExbD/TolR family protein n=1 Tax=Methylacidimicrobium sp. B4 TaxID=2796139 RepID=UPI001A8FEE43|nr:biopolymer transporter ExbD [Methylacidimicrobium sp. B4]QSR84173.1 biopolymer transporter ExbD [Methylacidimicrobium sp. B4]
MQPRLALLRGTTDLVPLVTVLFLLLLFFLLGSSFVTQPGFVVELPKSSLGVRLPSEGWIVSVTLTPETKGNGGRKPLIFCHDELLDLPGFRKLLEESSRGRPPQTLVIRADKEAPAGLLVEIMNIALTQKWSVLLATQPEGEQPGGP